MNEFTTQPKCPECFRVFDLFSDAESDEWFNGHDCEENND